MNLRDEIIEHAKARVELHKWKIILVAGLGYAGSGLIGTPSAVEQGCLLALILWASIYTDLLCRDSVLKTGLIAKYLRETHRLGKEPSDGEYQEFSSQASTMTTQTIRQSVQGQLNRIWRFRTPESTANVYAFEVYALNWSTVAVSIGIVLWGLALGLGCKVECLLILNALLALAVSEFLYLAYARRWGALQHLTIQSASSG
jgi:hypothetical protein